MRGLRAFCSGVKTKQCDVGASESGAPLVHCVVPDNIGSYLVDVTATAPTQQSSETTAVHATWGDGATNGEVGGNYKTIDSLTFGP